MLFIWTACDGLVFAKVNDFNKSSLCFMLTESDFADRGFSGRTLVFAVELCSGLCLIFFHFIGSKQIEILDMGQRILLLLFALGFYVALW